MTREQLCEKIDEAIEGISFEGKYVNHRKYGSGHINDTFLVIFSLEDGSDKKYILQRMNTEIFDPVLLMENISGVTSFLRKKIIEQKGDPDRECLSVIPTKEGKTFFKDSIGSYWRAYLFITNARTYDKVEKPEDFYQSAVTFGKFQNLLSEYDANSLHETIKDFHNTPKRLNDLKDAVKKDKMNRVKDAQKEIRFVMEQESDTSIGMNLLKAGELPLRVTHNDTKLNNVMIDNDSRKGICVIDLDTVMPGLSIFDFGDSIRFGANTAQEDETDFEKASLDLKLFEIYAKGFLEGCEGSLTQKEIEMLPMGAKIMTLECGMRFLTDYLEGDVYFNINRSEHNLDRCRTQFKLFEDMENKKEQMELIIKKIISQGNKYV